jgi:ribosomal protein L12E/L44/L45/RPP1/RPP2
MLAGADLKNLLGSANVNVSDDDLNRLVASLKGKDVNKLIASGLAKVGSSGPAPAAKGDSKPAVQ